MGYIFPPRSPKNWQNARRIAGMRVVLWLATFCLLGAIINLLSLFAEAR